MEDFEYIEYEVEGKEEKKEEVTTIDIEDKSTQTYNEDFEELEYINIADDMEKVGLEIINEIKKVFNDFILLFST